MTLQHLCVVQMWKPESRQACVIQCRSELESGRVATMLGVKYLVSSVCGEALLTWLLSSVSEDGVSPVALTGNPLTRQPPSADPFLPHFLVSLPGDSFQRKYLHFKT